jgi:hypothetical protein
MAKGPSIHRTGALLSRSLQCLLYTGSGGGGIGSDCPDHQKLGIWPCTDPLRGLSAAAAPQRSQAARRALARFYGAWRGALDSRAETALRMGNALAVFDVQHCSVLAPGAWLLPAPSCQADARASTAGSGPSAAPHHSTASGTATGGSWLARPSSALSTVAASAGRAASASRPRGLSSTGRSGSNTTRFIPKLGKMGFGGRGVFCLMLQSLSTQAGSFPSVPLYEGAL